MMLTVKKPKIAVLASGGGSNLGAIIDRINNKQLEAEISVVLSDNKEAFALKRAEKAGVPSFYVAKKERDSEILKYLTKYSADVVVLAGYLKKIGNNILKQYKGKIINIHPSLLPKYGGPGMYGMNVHRAVIENKEKVSVELGIYYHGFKFFFD